MLTQRLRHILLVDDDALLRKSLAFSLQRAGYRVTTEANAEDALRLLQRDAPDLVLLDIGLPGMDGLDAFKALRSSGKTPVIFLTGRRRELDQVLGLELGADDYVTKPFDKDVLLARIKAVLRRMESLQPGSAGWAPLQVGNLRIDPQAHTAFVGERAVDLAPREFDLLHLLAEEAGCVLSVDELLKRIWGPDFFGEPQVVYVHIRWLREKIEKDPHRPTRIISVRGVGYKLQAVEE